MNTIKKALKVLKIICWTVFVVVFVFGVFLGLGLWWGVQPALAASKVYRAESDIKVLKMNLSTYKMLNEHLPTTEQGLQSFVTKPTIEPIPSRWRQLMEKLPRDPWKKPYVYRNPGRFNPSGYDLYSLGPDRKESDDDIGKNLK